MSGIRPSVSYSFTMRLNIDNRTGMLAQIINAVAAEQGDPGAVDVVKVEGTHKVRDLTVSARDEDHSRAIVAAVEKIDGVEVRSVSDRVFLLHLNYRKTYLGLQARNGRTARDAAQIADSRGSQRAGCALTGYSTTHTRELDRPRLLRNRLSRGTDTLLPKGVTEAVVSGGSVPHFVPVRPSI